jgi:hypothetical protein
MSFFLTDPLLTDPPFDIDAWVAMLPPDGVQLTYEWHRTLVNAAIAFHALRSDPLSPSTRDLPQHCRGMIDFSQAIVRFINGVNAAFASAGNTGPAPAAMAIGKIAEWLLNSFRASVAEAIAPSTADPIAAFEAAANAVSSLPSANLN